MEIFLIQKKESNSNINQNSLTNLDESNYENSQIDKFFLDESYLDEQEKEFSLLVDKIYNLNEVDNEILKLYKTKKIFNIKQKDFRNCGNKLYEKAKYKKYFQVSDTHFKNLYQAKYKELNPNTLSEIFEY